MAGGKRFTSFGRKRDYTIDALVRGEIPPSDAARIAQQQDTEARLKGPDPAQFDPMQQAFWSVAMVLTWIMTRDEECVRDMWDAWRIGFEIREQHSGLLIRTLAPACLLHLDAIAPHWRHEAKLLRDKSDVKAELHARLQEGTIQAVGRPAADGARIKIPAHEWIDLNWCDEAGSIVCRSEKGIRNGYDDVQFELGQIVSAWPRTKKKALIQTKPMRSSC